MVKRNTYIYNYIYTQTYIYILYYLMPYQLSMSGKMFHLHAAPWLCVKHRLFSSITGYLTDFFFWQKQLWIKCSPWLTFRVEQLFLNPAHTTSPGARILCQSMYFLQKPHFAWSGSPGLWVFSCTAAMNEIIDITLGTIFITFGNKVGVSKCKLA